MWTTIKNKFTSLGETLGSSIGGAVKSAINSVLRLIQDRINDAIDIINKAIKVANDITHAGFKGISRIVLPRLAKGGIIDSPTIAQIGESGREAVIPLENNKGWIKELASELANTTVKLSTPEKAEMNYNMYNELVRSFKDALSQMKVVLDDDEMGTFVEKTVARAIYS